jgi:hypothetical protein
VQSEDSVGSVEAFDEGEHVVGDLLPAAVDGEGVRRSCGRATVSP